MKSFTGTVTDAGGGIVEILVDRDTEEYPERGSKVLVSQDEEENKKLKAALSLWQEFSMDASSMYESTLRYKITSVSKKVKEILNSD